MSAGVVIVGGGAWGVALALALARDGRPPRMLEASAERRGVLEAELSERAAKDEFPSGAPSLIASADMVDSVASADAILLAVPTQSLRGALASLPSSTRAPVVLCCKGLEINRAKLPSEIAAEILPDAPRLSLCGPTFAADVVAGRPAFADLAADPIELAERVARRLESPALRLRPRDDLVGVELGGALKNVYALASGIVRGVDAGESASAAALVAAFDEMSRIAEARGAKRDTLLGLSGFGDFVMTCSSPTSRNTALGIELARAERDGDDVAARLADSSRPLAEGAASASAARDEARRLGVDAPICEIVADIASAEGARRAA